MALFLKTSDYGWIWPILLGSVITFASSQRVVETPSALNLDKAAHFFVFGLLATLLFRYPSDAFKKRSHAIYAITATALFGLSDELHQFSQQFRYFEGSDLAADCLGALTAVAVYRYWVIYRKFLEKELFQFTRLWHLLKSSKSEP